MKILLALAVSSLPLAASALERAPELPSLAEFSALLEQRQPASAKPVAFVEADDAQTLTSLRGEIRIHFDAPVDLPAAWSEVTRTDGIYHFVDGVLLEAGSGSPLVHTYDYNRLNKDLATLGGKPMCDVGVLFIDRPADLAGTRPLNGHRDLRVRDGFERWLKEYDKISPDANEPSRKFAAASVLRDPQLRTERQPHVENVMCSNGRDAETFTVGELRQAFGRSRTRVLVSRP